MTRWRGIGLESEDDRLDGHPFLITNRIDIPGVEGHGLPVA